MYQRIRFLNGNTLKILAAIFMLIDHMGLMFFPREEIYRIIGRLAFPIFAFMIAEGAKYTRNKLYHFFLMASLATVCQVVYYWFDRSLYMCILVTFSLSLLLIYSLKLIKITVFSDKCKNLEKILSLGLFLALLTGIYFLNEHFEIDYGFSGILVPVFASLFDFRGVDAPEFIKKLDNLFVRIASFSVGLLLLAISAGGIQYYSLFAIILLLLYSGKRGKVNMKYFFYLFYPLHLVILEFIYIAIYYL